jgi:hypothetical protein
LQRRSRKSCRTKRLFSALAWSDTGWNAHVKKRNSVAILARNRETRIVSGIGKRDVCHRQIGRSADRQTR